MTKKVDFDRYTQLSSDKKEVVNQWFKQAWNYRDCNSAECFFPFMSAWIAFNSWTACITEEDMDSKIIEILCEDETLKKDFDDLLKNKRISERIELFYTKLPIVLVKNIRKFKRTLEKLQKGSDLDDSEKHILMELNLLEPNPNTELTDYDINSVFSEQFKRIKYDTSLTITTGKKGKVKDFFAPKCWIKNRKDFRKIDRNWTNTIQSLYRVRCNLFHGEKSLYIRDDREIVSSAFQAMIYIFCYIFYKHNVIDSRDYDIVQLLEINSSSSSLVEEESEDFKF